MKPAIVHIITKLELGGAQQNTLYTCDHLDRTRYDVHLMCGPEGELMPEARAINDLGFIPIRNLERPVDPAADAAALTEMILALRDIKRRAGKLVVHTHCSKAGILGRLAARAAGANAIIHTIHGFGFDALGGPLMRRVGLVAERAAARVTDRFIAVSRSNLDEGIGLRLFSESKAEVVYSGIALDEFALSPTARKAARQQVRKELGVSPRAPVVGMLACLKPQKRPVDFVLAAARIREAHPAAHFFIAGDGELRPEVTQAIEENGLTGCFHLLGWRRDVPALLAAMDVMALSSAWEGLPRVLPQAMAAGVVPVATRVDGSPEAIEDGVSGYLCHPGDIYGMSEQIIELLSKPALRRKMAAAGRQHVAAWDADTMVSAQEAIYDRLLSSP